MFERSCMLFVQPRMTLHILAYPRMPSNALVCPSMLSHGLTSSHIFASLCMPLHDLVHLRRPLHVLSHPHAPLHASHVLAHCYVLVQAHRSSHALACPPHPLARLSHPRRHPHSLIHPSMLLQVFALPCMLSHTLTCLQMPLYTCASPHTPSHMLGLVACSHALGHLPTSLHALIRYCTASHNLTCSCTLSYILTFLTCTRTHLQASHALACPHSPLTHPSTNSFILAHSYTPSHVHMLSHVLAHHAFTCSCTSSHALAQPRMLLHAVSCRPHFLACLRKPSHSLTCSCMQ